MTANLETVNGKTSFFSNREVPWHRLGTVTDAALTAEQALQEAQLDWDVSLAPALVKVPGATRLVQVPDKFAVVRDNPSTEGEPIIPLGIVGNQYTPIQNREAFGFLDELIEAVGGAHYETAGVLGDGEKVFLTIKMPEDLVIDPNGANDHVEQYILVSNSHNGSSAFTAAVTPVRVVCQNTLTAGLRAAKRTWKARHTSNVAARMDEARRTLNLTVKYAEEFAAAAEQMIQQAMTDREFDKLTQRLYGVGDDASGRTKTAANEHRGELVRLFKEAPTNENIRGTRWAAFNAVTEFEDWTREFKAGATVGREQRRAASSLFGPVAQRKEAAFELLLQS